MAKRPKSVAETEIGLLPLRDEVASFLCKTFNFVTTGGGFGFGQADAEMKTPSGKLVLVSISVLEDE